MDIKIIIFITVACSALLSSSVAVSFQQAETCSSLKKIWQHDIMTLLSILKLVDYYYNNHTMIIWLVCMPVIHDETVTVFYDQAYSSQCA